MSVMLKYKSKLLIEMIYYMLMNHYLGANFYTRVIEIIKMAQQKRFSAELKILTAAKVGMKKCDVSFP